ncbi:MAG: hypothetical protein ACLUDU_00155 [Butyricimonas faecihominis]
MNELPEYIVQLVVKSLKKELTEEEQKQIEEWKEAHPEQADEFKRLQVYVKTGYDISTFKGIDVNAAVVDRQTGKEKEAIEILLVGCRCGVIILSEIFNPWRVATPGE